MSPLLSRKTFFGLLIILVLVLAVLTGVFLLKKTPVPVIVAPVNTDPVVTILGRSVGGREIKAYTYLPTQAGTSTDRIIFVGGIHGGYEWNSVLLSYKFMDYLAANPATLPKNLAVTVIPSANPDGVFQVIKKEGRFTAVDVPANVPVGTGRFNLHGVDLNRNFACNWQATSTWQNKKVSAGTAAFSEPEAKALKDFILEAKPKAVIFWHSQSNAVYASACNNGILPQTLTLMDAYALAAGYPAVKTFDSYAITGDASDWLASVNIPSFTVELKTHETIEWEKNLAGIKSLIGSF